MIVGNVPATYDSQGNLVSVGQGSLTILDRNGNVVTTISDPTLLDGPWDLTINDQGSQAQVFVSNVLNGMVTRIDLKIPNGGNPIVESQTQIASGYLTRTDRRRSWSGRPDWPTTPRTTPSMSPRRVTTRSSPSRTRGPARPMRGRVESSTRITRTSAGRSGWC